MGRTLFTARSKKAPVGTRRRWCRSYKSSRWDTTCRLERLSETEVFQALRLRQSIKQPDFVWTGPGRVLRAPMSYFDTTVKGRIINRFSSDLASVDSEV